LRDGGELSPRMWTDYKEITDRIVAAFGKGRVVADLRPDDFAALRAKAAKTWGVHRLSKLVQCTRSVFKYAFDTGLIPTPVRFGPGFARPSKKTLRLHRAKDGPKLFTADEIRRLIDAAHVQPRAMILLGINAGFGNGDCAGLRRAHVDLDAG